MKGYIVVLGVGLLVTSSTHADMYRQSNGREVSTTTEARITNFGDSSLSDRRSTLLSEYDFNGNGRIDKSENKILQRDSAALQKRSHYKAGRQVTTTTTRTTTRLTNLSALATRPDLWPAQVVLTRRVDFPAGMDGRIAGTVGAEAGDLVDLISVTDQGLVVRYLGNQTIIPASATDLGLQLAGR